MSSVILVEPRLPRLNLSLTTLAESADIELCQHYKNSILCNLTFLEPLAEMPPELLWE